MEVVGIIATVVGGLVLLVALGLAVRSIPELARYRRLRKM